MIVMNGNDALFYFKLSFYLIARHIYELLLCSVIVIM